MSLSTPYSSLISAPSTKIEKETRDILLLSGESAHGLFFKSGKKNLPSWGYVSEVDNAICLGYLQVVLRVCRRFLDTRAGKLSPDFMVRTCVMSGELVLLFRDFVLALTNSLKFAVTTGSNRLAARFEEEIVDA